MRVDMIAEHGRLSEKRCQAGQCTLRNEVGFVPELLCNTNYQYKGLFAAPKHDLAGKECSGSQNGMTKVIERSS